MHVYVLLYKGTKAKDMYVNKIYYQFPTAEELFEDNNIDGMTEENAEDLASKEHSYTITPYSGVFKLQGLTIRTQ